MFFLVLDRIISPGLVCYFVAPDVASSDTIASLFFLRPKLLGHAGPVAPDVGLVQEIKGLIPSRWLLLRWLCFEARSSVVDEMTTISIGTGAGGVERPAEVSFVLWMSGHGPDFMLSVGELTLGSVSTGSCFDLRSAEFSFVEVGNGFGCGWWSLPNRFVL